ncbi:unnamed protein product [Clonostachys rosea]|uniref:Uncharacterized protein n=1 Tax=Bionectria ochroleuca TaxID=29856 RepID=A0ABY6UPQ4_BIOOC|nr:unnamed protein product [Clonostachys rosea]
MTVMNGTTGMVAGVIPERAYRDLVRILRGMAMTVGRCVYEVRLLLSCETGEIPVFLEIGEKARVVHGGMRDEASRKGPKGPKGAGSGLDLLADYDGLMAASRGWPILARGEAWPRDGLREEPKRSEEPKFQAS